MKLKSVILFLSLILPVLIFLFLRQFGKNEFAVEPLYATTLPDVGEDCSTTVVLPYHVPDTIRTQLGIQKNGLVVLVFGELEKDAQHELARLEGKFTKDEVTVLPIAVSGKEQFWKDCVFFMKKPTDIALVDYAGTIRGQYESREREEIDRLITEATIILKKY